MGYLWGKLIYGSFLRVTALADKSIVQGIQDPECRAACVRLAREIIAVADLEGVSLRGFNGFDSGAFRNGRDAADVGRTFDAMADFNSGSEITHACVWRDVAIRKRKTETRWQYTPFVELAAQRCIGTPSVRRLMDCFDAVERNEIEIGAQALIYLAATPQIPVRH